MAFVFKKTKDIYIHLRINLTEFESVYDLE